MSNPRIGVSMCLLGVEVRHDGAHKLEPWIAEVLFEHANLVSVCPEIEIGLGIPREPISLVRDGGRVALLATVSGNDLTERMQAFAERRVSEIGHLDGYITKSRSPSCGFEDADVIGAGLGDGMFVAELRRQRPHLPIATEVALRDPVLRRDFLERVWNGKPVPTVLFAG